ncbi:MAG: hypothetical protein IH964_07435 [Candidatus Dadabacteria bacterium]|nr:hypothetical protein [Candidatus Dadabacteria bacterium]
MLSRNQIFLSAVFILVAGFFFLSTPNTSYAQSDCCFANGTPGCDDALCEADICGEDPFCCNVEWDGLCADAANLECAICLAPPPPVGCCTGLGTFPDACEILTEEECINDGGIYQGDDTNCNDFNECFVHPIPTMSEWGLIAFAGIWD